MNPLGDRARAEELARLLEGAVAGPTASTAGMAALATRLRGVAPALDDSLTLRPEFRAQLRQRLLAVATVSAAAPAVAAPAQERLVDRAVTWSRTWSAQRRLAALSGAMAGVIGLTGVGIASSRSLPGQPFYALKRASEGLQLDLAGNDTAKGNKHLEFAATRLREVAALAHGDSELAVGSVHTLAAGSALGGSVQKRITDTLHDFDSEATSGRQLLEGVYRRTGKTEPLRILNTFSLAQTSKLTALLPDLPSGTADAAQSSLQLVADIGRNSAQLLAIGACTGACNPAGGGPVLPTESPAPAPGASATPGGGDNNGVPGCTCPEPSMTPEPTPEPTTEPSPTPTPTQSPTGTPSPTGSPSPTGLPIPLPTLPPSILPTIIPTILPTKLPPLPAPLESVLPTLLPSVIKP